MFPRDERLLGNDDDNDVVIIVNDPRWLNLRTPAGAGAGRYNGVGAIPLGADEGPEAVARVTQ